MRQTEAKISSNRHNANERIRMRKRKKRRSPVRIITILLCVLIGVFCADEITGSHERIVSRNLAFVSHHTQAMPTHAIAPHLNQRVIPTAEITTANLLVPNMHINSANAALMDFETGTVLFDRNGAAKMYPASMTKIMTGIVALEHIKDLDEKVFLNEAMFQPIYSANASTAGFVPGESVRAIDLLYGLLLPSGAECAVGLAEYVAGSETAFVRLMNAKAHEIGMDSSHFTNTTGLHDDNHYSTAMDMAALFRYALANDMFYEIITSSRYSTPTTNKHDGGITFYSTLFSKTDSLDVSGGSILGGKTGYTEEAGQCLASLAVKDGIQYILVTSGAVGNNQTQKLHIEDAFTVYAAMS